MAQSMGEIRLVLRPFGEDQTVQTKGARPGDVARANTANNNAQPEEGPEGRVPASASRLEFPEGSNSSASPATTAAREPEAPPPPRTHTLIIHNGESVTKAVFVIDHKGEATTRDIDRQEVVPRPEKSAPTREPSQPEQEPSGGPALSPARRTGS
jgi:hypothetical protein